MPSSYNYDLGYCKHCHGVGSLHQLQLLSNIKFIILPCAIKIHRLMKMYVSIILILNLSYYYFLMYINNQKYGLK